MKKTKLFENIAGYDDVKHELMEIYSWYQDKALINNKDIRLPKGVIFYGPAGNGKTLFVREFSNAIKAKSFSINGLSKDIGKEIHTVFENARKEDFALILIDEIDLLINKNPIVVRTLLSEMDGLNVKGNILILATSNSHIFELPDPLLRQGRFDRAININNPSYEEIMELYKFNLNKLKIDFKDIDLVHLSNLSRCVSCSDIKSIVNDAYLRAKDKMITRDLEKSYERLVNKDYSDINPIKYRNMKAAIHEAGHAIMALRFSKDYRLYNAKFTKFGGITHTYPINKEEDTIEKRVERIQITLSGMIAEKIFFKKHDIGSYSDLEKANDLSKRLVERSCCVSLKDFHSPRMTREGMKRSDTELHHEEIEKHSWKILRKQKKLAYKYLRRHKKDLEKFANMLYEKGEVNLHDLQDLKTNITNEPISYSYIPKTELAFAKKKEVIA